MKVFNSYLKFPPVKNTYKPNKIPNFFVIEKDFKSDLIQDNLKTYIGFSNGLQKGNCIMECYIDSNTESLFIHDLKSFPQGIGMGANMLHFAKKLSEHNGYKGNLSLYAYSKYNPERVPQPFYYKYGFKTLDPKLNKLLAKCVKQKETATVETFNSTYMYYKPRRKIKFKLISIIKKFAKHIQHLCIR